MSAHNPEMNLMDQHDLAWIDDRWHLDGRGIHAGNCLEIRWPDGTWEEVRIESGDRGRTLYAHFDHHGRDMVVRVDYGLCLRWRR